MASIPMMPRATLSSACDELEDIAGALSAIAELLDAADQPTFSRGMLASLFHWMHCLRADGALDRDRSDAARDVIEDLITPERGLGGIDRTGLATLVGIVHERVAVVHACLQAETQP